ncbi:MAG: cold shock domain-containing protein [Devosia sp.]
MQPEAGSRDILVHISAVKRAGLTELAEGQKLQFDIEKGRDGRDSAGNLSLID